MALSNWDTLAVALDGTPQAGFYVSPAGVRVEIYKNWIYVYDEKGWTEDGGFSKPCVMSIEHGHITYKDITIQVIRGPQQGVYGACWCHKWEDKKNHYEGFVGCGVYGFEGEEWVGVKPTSVDFLRSTLSHNIPAYDEDEITEFMEIIQGNSEIEKAEHEKYLREVRDFDFPEEIAGVKLDQVIRYNQGNMYFAEKAGMPLDATEPGKSGEPAIMTIIDSMKS